MRNLFVLLFFALTILNLVVYANSGDRVAGQFDADGRPTRWMSREGHFFLMQGLETFLFLLFYFMPALLARIPLGWVNLPHREYWLAPENRDTTKEKLTVLMADMGVYLFLFLGILTWITYRAHRTPEIRLPMTHLWLSLLLFLGLTVFWCIRFYSAFRKPEA